VVDVDEEAGFRRVRLSIPKTWAVQSPSGGTHYYYRSAKPIRSGHALCGNIKAEGGFVILPPTPGYTVFVDTDIAQAPSWLEDGAVRTKPRSPIRTGARNHPGIKVVLNIPIDQAMKWGVPRGQRVSQGCKIAFILARWEAATWNETWQFLRAWNEKNKPPLTQKELEQELWSKARSSYDEGASHAGFVNKRRFLKTSLRNRIIRYLKYVSAHGQQPMVGLLETYVHAPAEQVRVELSKLEAGGWLRLEPSGKGQRVVWTGAGVESLADVRQHGSIYDVKPWKPNRGHTIGRPRKDFW
jgi:hypothetical protein